MIISQGIFSLLGARPVFGNIGVVVAVLKRVAALRETVFFLEACFFVLVVAVEDDKGATTTVADEKSIAFKPFAVPSAVPILIVVAVRFARQV
jgi:hypothetical protein